MKGNSIPQKPKFPENSLIKENEIPKKRVLPEVSVDQLVKLNKGSDSSLFEELKDLFQELTTWGKKFWEHPKTDFTKHPSGPPPRPMKDNSEG